MNEERKEATRIKEIKGRRNEIKEGRKKRRKEVKKGRKEGRKAGSQGRKEGRKDAKNE